MLLTLPKIEDYIPISGCTSLKTIDLHSVNIINFSFLNGFGELEKLRMYYCKELRDISALPSCPKLRTLLFKQMGTYLENSCEYIGECLNLRDLIFDDVPVIIELKLIGNLKKLIRLELSFLFIILHLEDIEGCESLECLLFMNYWAKDTSIKINLIFLKNLKKLREIYLIGTLVVNLEDLLKTPVQSLVYIKVNCTFTYLRSGDG